jgi:hypothetical protein
LKRLNQNLGRASPPAEIVTVRTPVKSKFLIRIKIEPMGRLNTKGNQWSSKPKGWGNHLKLPSKMIEIHGLLRALRELTDTQKRVAEVIDFGDAKPRQNQHMAIYPLTSAVGRI